MVALGIPLAFSIDTAVFCRYGLSETNIQTFAEWVRLGCFWGVGESAKKPVNGASDITEIKRGTSEPAQPSIP